MVQSERNRLTGEGDGFEPGAIDTILRRRLSPMPPLQGCDRGVGRNHLIEVVDIAEVATQYRFRHLDVNAVRQQLTVYDRPGNLYHGVESLRRLTQLLVFDD